MWQDAAGRLLLAIIFGLLVVGVVAVALADHQNVTVVLDWLEPIIMVIIGFYFGQASARTRKK